MSDDRFIADDPRWLAHRFDPGRQAYHFAFMPREAHRRTSFLNDHHMAGVERRMIPRASASSASARAPLHFVFHSGLTCSTLLARALDREGVAMTLKEPTILNDLVVYRLSGARPADFDAALNETLALLARPFAPGEPVIVKTASIANSLAEAALEARPDSRALCLYAPLPIFLGSIARKGLMGRLWGRKLFIGLLNARLVDLGFADQDYLQKTDLQIAALAWLAQQAIFDRLLRRFGGDRVRSIDSETLMARLDDSLAAIGGHFELALTEETIASITGGPVFQSHAKSGEAFDSQQRTRELDVAMAAHADEIDKVAAWSAKVAEAAGFEIDLGHRLIT